MTHYFGLNVTFILYETILYLSMFVFLSGFLSFAFMNVFIFIDVPLIDKNSLLILGWRKMVEVTLKVVSVKNWWRSCDHFTCIHSKSKVEECKGFDGDYVIILYTSTQSQKWRSVKDLMETMWSFYIPPFKVKSGGV